MSSQPTALGWDLDEWPWDRAGIRLLPVQHGRLEFARAVRAHLDAFDPETVVVEIPRPAAETWLRAVELLPQLHAVRLEFPGDDVAWLLPEPTDASVEAARWARARGRKVVCADLVVPRYPARRDALPDPAVIPEIGYAPYVRAAELSGCTAHNDSDAWREQALSAAALKAAHGGRRVALVFGLCHLTGILERLARGSGGVPLQRPVHVTVSLVPLHDDALGEVLTEPPYVEAAWERARAGERPCLYQPPSTRARPARVIGFADRRAQTPEDRVGSADEKLERDAEDRGDDLLGRARLLYRLVQHACALARETASTEPSVVERRVLHRLARNLALLEGRVSPDLYELVLAARAAVDDRFARDVMNLATHWPWARGDGSGVRLKAQDVGHSTRLVTLRPRIDRLAKRPALREVLRRIEEQGEGRHPAGICSHQPEDVVVEGLGASLRKAGRARSVHAAAQVAPFTTSLLDGLDVRETIRRYITDGRPWVREEIREPAQVGAVVIVFDEDDDDRQYPWREVWHGEHANESDMAFFASDPRGADVAPGIHRAEYGGFLLIWPPRRMGDIWRDPAYRFARGKAERLLIAGLDYSLEPLVAFVSRRPARSRMHSIARRLGKRIIHIPPGALSRDKLRRIRTFHVLAGRHLRPIAEHVIDPN